MYFFMQKLHEEVKKESMKYHLFYLCILPFVGISLGLRPTVFNTGRCIGVTMTMIGAIPRIDQVFLFLVWIYPEFYTFLHYPCYYTIYFMSIQVFGLFSITSVTSMDMSYIPIAEARGFTTHLIKLKKQLFFFKLFLQFSNKDKGVKRSGLIQVKVEDCICTLFFSAAVHDLHILRE